jgi:hypothetical protein
VQNTENAKTFAQPGDLPIWIETVFADEFRHRGLDPNPFLLKRVPKRQFAGAQGEPLASFGNGRLIGTIKRITQDGMSRRREMGANLMRATSQRLGFDQCFDLGGLEDAKMGFGVLQ